ncbi:MAG: gamma-glutamyltransferase [Saprospiraceae bacterium]|nr:gamma-glutamyltransferase [Saprospiraceae bacterium]
MQNNSFLNTLSKISFFFTLIILIQCKQASNNASLYNITKSIEADSAMVVTAHPVATEIGINILHQGGNAADAAIAVQFALAVCYPGAGNIGGGGFMVYRGSSGEINTLDFREKAPSKATTDMYLDSIGNPISHKSIYGHLAAGVPGSVDGMVEIFKKYSKLKDWKKLIQPSIDLAKNGFRITEREAKNLNEEQQNFNKYNLNKTAFQKDLWIAGDLLVQKELASTLEKIRDEGRDGFYAGIVAEQIANEMKAGGGLISIEDLKNYTSIWRKPLTSKYREYRIITMPPPSSGGIALIQLLKMVEPYDLMALKFHSAASVHLLVEAERRVYADRSKHLGDADFYPVPINRLLDSTYIVHRMSDFNPRLATKSEQCLPGEIHSEETTHFSIIDAEGNAVSITTTLNGGYGAFTVVKDAGFILNNEMDDFSIKAGTPNMYGLIGAVANKIEPNKRMLSSMTPTIIEKNGNLLMVVGTPGGSTIITSVFQTIVNVLDYNQTINEAVQAPRFHHQWLPDIVQIEKDAIDLKERKILESIGHNFKERGPIGRVEAIYITDKGKLSGAADHRGDDDAKGY